MGSTGHDDVDEKSHFEIICPKQVIMISNDACKHVHKPKRNLNYLYEAAMTLELECFSFFFSKTGSMKHTISENKLEPSSRETGATERLLYPTCASPAEMTVSFSDFLWQIRAHLFQACQTSPCTVRKSRQYYSE